MRNRQDIHRHLIERFTERAEELRAGPVEIVSDDPMDRVHLRRFLNMVAMRKQQMLERLLMDGD